MKKRLVGMLAILVVCASLMTATNRPASAMTCYWNVSQTKQAWDGTNYLSFTFQHKWQYDFWGNCQYSYHLKVNSSNGGPARALSAQLGIRVWVNGAYQYDSDMAACGDSGCYWYGYGYEWNADTKWVTYGTYPPSADIYLSTAATDAPGSHSAGVNILFTF